jgi:hypothetical protein
MDYAGFTDLAEAIEWRKKYGGWIFKADTGDVLWFCNRLMPSDIMRHRATRGLSGTVT